MYHIVSNDVAKAHFSQKLGGQHGKLMGFNLGPGNSHGRLTLVNLSHSGINIRSLC